MSSLPQTPAVKQSVAFQFGAQDAQRGEPCVPECIFIQRQQQVEYATGWESQSGATATTAQFTGSPLPKPGALWARYESYKFGWDIFTAREPLSNCRNDEQRRGWGAACYAQAAADYEEDMLDREYHARGAW
jgi:hypothetical protein